MSEKKRIRFFVSGLVQGVFFRKNTAKKASKLGLTGWVRNLSDGRVEALIEGDQEKAKEMMRWMEEGPSSAKVENVESEEEEYKGEFNNFKIK